MSDRRQFEQRQQGSGGEIQPLKVDFDKLADHIAQVTMEMCNALVKRGFSKEEALFLASKFVPHIM